MNKLRVWLTPIAVAATLVVNGLAVMLPLFGKSTAELSDAYPTLFTPAGYVFSIWGLIYLLLIIYAVWRVLPENQNRVELQKLDPWFWLAAVMNCTWIFLWHGEILWATVIVMVVLLVSLLVLYQLTRNAAFASKKDFWLVQVPISVYTGWISVATIANISVYLYDIRWDGFGIAAAVWAMIMIYVAGVLAAAQTTLHKDVVYAGVILWAVIGILVKFMDTSPEVSGAALITACIVATFMLDRIARIMQVLPTTKKQRI